MMFHASRFTFHASIIRSHVLKKKEGGMNAAGYNQHVLRPMLLSVLPFV
ncbi:hypothetical protein QUF80_20450 [Desulfococcaceae bacterium HSG8]|nr:hypothetical protein [Desulfococcaceae bacterium HSG8]